jgi:hypothetical protein
MIWEWVWDWMMQTVKGRLVMTFEEETPLQLWLRLQWESLTIMGPFQTLQVMCCRVVHLHWPPSPPEPQQQRRSRNKKPKPALNSQQLKKIC